MTNPHPPSFFRTLAKSKACQPLETAKQRLTLAVVIVVGLTAFAAKAQSVEALEWQPGQSLATKFVISTPHNDVRKLLRQAKYAQALVLVNKSLASKPRDPQMRFWQAYIYERLGQPDMAAQVYLDLTREFPELGEPFNNLGVIYAAKGDYPSAKLALDNALRANPNYAAAHENMGDLLVNMARQSYQRSLGLDPSQRGPAKKIEQLTPLLNLTQDKP